MKYKLYSLLLAAICTSWEACPASAQRSAGPASMVSPVATLQEIHPFPCPEGKAASAGSLTGTVSDRTGAFVPHVRIEVRHLASGYRRTSATDDRGRFAFAEVGAGSYEVMAIAPAFEIAVFRDVRVTACSETVLNIVLRVAPAKTDITVTDQSDAGTAAAIAARESQTSDTASLLAGVPGIAPPPTGASPLCPY